MEGFQSRAGNLMLNLPWVSMGIGLQNPLGTDENFSSDQHICNLRFSKVFKPGSIQVFGVISSMEINGNQLSKCLMLLGCVKVQISACWVLIDPHRLYFCPYSWANGYFLCPRSVFFLSIAFNCFELFPVSYHCP